jgi:hypothetical protein
MVWIWLLLSTLYVSLGWLYAEFAWNDSTIKEDMEDMYLRIPEEERVDSLLAFLKLTVVTLWPLFFFTGLAILAYREVQKRMGGEE